MEFFMTLLLEQPLAVVIVGVVVALGTGIAWTSTGRKEWLIALGAIVALTIMGLVVEQLVVTDREAIEATLREIARDVESNNLPALLKHVSAGNTELTQKATAEMPNYLRRCRVTRCGKRSTSTPPGAAVGAR
jgi:hypothetical protein